MVEDKLLCVAETLERLGISRTKFYAEISAGRLTAVKIGRSTKVRAREVQRYIGALPVAAHKVGA